MAQQTVGSGPDTLVLKISEDAYQGDAQYTVRVDGVQVGGTFTAAALHGSGQSDTLTLNGDWATGAHRVEVNFLNDAWGGTAATDRNLYVDGATYDGAAVPGAGLSLLSTGPQSFGFTDTGGTTAPPPPSGGTPQAVSLQAGSGPDALVLRISQDAYQGSAQYTVRVDGVQVGGTFTASALHGSGQSDTLTLNGDWATGAHRVEVNFLNDAWGGTAATDRNLYVDGATYDGAAVSGAGLSLLSAGPQSFGFTDTGGTTAPPPPSGGTPQPVSLQAGSGPDALVLRISQDAYQGSAQYTVRVDGVQVGGTFTASALHGSGQSDTLTLNGDWATGAHRVEVNFLNDAWGGTAATDRNLYVDGATYDGAAVPGAGLSLMSAGAKGFVLPEANEGLDTLSVHLSGDAWNGTPKASLTVNGVPVGGTFEVSAAHAKDDAQVFTVTGKFGDAPVAALSFVNDAGGSGPAEDRNLYLEGFTYNGVEHRGLKKELYYNQTVEYELGGAPAQAERAADFLDNLGAVVHLDYFNTAYGLNGGTNTPLILSSLQYVGVQNIRVGIPTPETLPALQVLADAGFTFDVLMPSTSSDQLLQAQLRSMHPFADSIRSIEGPNETNLTGDFSWNGSRGDAAARAYQAALYDAVNVDPVLADKDVYALTLAGVGDNYYEAFGPDMAASADVGNMHVYFINGLAPASTVRYALRLADLVTPGLPVAFTETNYTSAPAIRGSVTEAVQAKYVLDLLMDTAQAGVEATYLYELIDVVDDPGQTINDAHYGLFRADGTPKPVAHGLHNLAAILADDQAQASTFETGALRYSLSGLPGSGNTMLLEKSSGEFDIAVWAEPELWDLDTQTEVPASHRTVTLTFASQQASVAAFDPLAGTEPVATYRGVSSVVLDVTDHPLLVEVGGWAV
jgi:hypothetical protein